MLGNSRGRKLDRYLADYVVFDLETTGISCERDRIVEIAAVKVKEGKIAEEFSALVNPGCPIPFRASEVNGITDEMVADAPGFSDVLPRFLDFIGDMVLVGHNIHSFDMNFLYRDCESCLGQTLMNDYVDTLSIARAVLPQMTRQRLTDLAEHYGIPTEGAHRALNDCRMNQQVYECLGREFEKAMQEGRTDKFRICPRCGQFLKKRNGRFGEFWGCGGYPQCRYTEKI